VLVHQGTSDNLFNLNQGLKIFTRALTPEARRRSLFVGFNGGHALPSAVPPGLAVAGDPCSAKLTRGSGFESLARRFFADVFAGRSPRHRGEAPFSIATAEGACLNLQELGRNRRFMLDQAISTAGAGGPLLYELAAGPITVAGTPYVEATVTTVGLDTRAFFALAVGTTPADARIVQNNMLPLRELLPVTGQRRRIELPAVAVRVPRGARLYLAVSPLSDHSFGHGSRIPGVVLLEDVRALVPVVAGR
jgi:hypothetical protein